MNELSIKIKKLTKAYDRIPVNAGSVAVRFSKERFRQENWLDRNRKKWAKRKLLKGSRRRNSRGILTDTGRLRRSIRVLYRSHSKIIIGTDVPYARINNEGGEINVTQNVKTHSRKRNGRTHKVKAHTRKMNYTMPKRQFIGNSAILNRRLERMIEKEFKKALK